MGAYAETLKVAAGALTIVACVALGTGPACAKGTMVIQQSNGETDNYSDVEIKILHNALYLTSEDAKGTIVITQAACSYQGQLMVCLPKGGTLVQSGETSPLDLKQGTIYLNSTDDPQQLVKSTTKVPAHSVLLSLTTKLGTYVTLSGRIDKVVK